MSRPEHRGVQRGLDHVINLLALRVSCTAAASALALLLKPMTVAVTAGLEMNQLPINGCAQDACLSLPIS